MKKAVDIFTPGALPTVTYNDRDHLRIEYKLLEAIETKGYISSVAGPSKSGKTVLCESVIGKRGMILLTGGGVEVEEDFWRKLRGVLLMPKETVVTKGQNKASEIAAGIEVGSGIPLLADAKSKLGFKKTDTGNSSLAHSYEGTTGLDLLDIVRTKDKTLVVDDFHYIPKKVQITLANQFKEAARNGCRIVVVSVTHRADDAIRANPDLRGRVVTVDIPYWTQDELRTIASKGFPELNLQIDSAIVTRMTTESIKSPQLMQALCLQLCREVGVEETLESPVSPVLSEDRIQRLLVNTSQIANCKYAFEILHAGPRTRGEERKIFTLADSTCGDVYYVILRALAAEEPLLTISYDNIKGRISRIVPTDPPRGVGIIGALEQMNEAVKEKLKEDRVLEWDDTNVNLPDPYFLYYLRWSLWEKNHTL